ncbi:MAG: permease [Myxococcaceae bacterium]|nr:permease [Myxococcaceae bacterium]
MERLTATLQSGATSLTAYLAAHVLLCLIPAFFIAGALSTLVPREGITRWLGAGAPRWIAYPVAALGGSLIAVCSCTVLPLFASIQKKGAGLGPAITFLFFAPAGNILALSYTGAALGGDFALARVALSIVFGVGIGLAMASLFPDGHGGASAAMPVAPSPVRPAAAALLVSLVGVLLAGTLKLAVLDVPVLSAAAAAPALATLTDLLRSLFPFDASRGEEGLTVHGLVLVLLLGVWSVVAWRGLTHVDDSLTRWSVAALGLTGLMLLVAATKVRVEGASLEVSLTVRTLVIAALLGVVTGVGRRLDPFDARQWLWETWRFVRQIMPLLLIGVFVVGLVRVWIRPEWVKAIAGQNTVLANLAGVSFGIVMYFPTLVEVPVAKMFLGLGMHPGPLLAYLMADPELSLQSVLVISKLLGARRTAGWIALVAVFSLGAGLLWGLGPTGSRPGGWWAVRSAGWRPPSGA